MRDRVPHGTLRPGIALRFSVGRGKSLEFLDFEPALVDLDRQCPGLRFRIVNEQDQVREHIRLFVNRTQADDLARPLSPSDEIQIILAISGG